MAKKWIQDARESMRKRGTEGSLHHMLHVPADKTISLDRLDTELKKRGISTLKRRRLLFAKNVRKHKAEAALDDFLVWARGYGVEVIGSAAALPVLRLPTTGRVVPGNGLRRIFERFHFTISDIRRAGDSINCIGLRHHGEIDTASEFKALAKALVANTALELDTAQLGKACLAYLKMLEGKGA
jgi:hypothetical protein